MWSRSTKYKSDVYLIINTLDVDKRLVNWWERKTCNLHRTSNRLAENFSMWFSAWTSCSYLCTSIHPVKSEGIKSNLILGAAHPSWQSRPPTYKNGHQTDQSNRTDSDDWPKGLLQSFCTFSVSGTIRKVNKRYWDDKYRQWLYAVAHQFLRNSMKTIRTTCEDHRWWQHDQFRH